MVALAVACAAIAAAVLFRPGGWFNPGEVCARRSYVRADGTRVTEETCTEWRSFP